MAKREPKPHTPCDHPVANWATIASVKTGVEYCLICRCCGDTVQRQFAGAKVPAGVLYRGPQGLYGPFSPRGWLM